jgi:hypothetical protein
MREGDSRFRKLSSMDHQNCARTAIATRIWRHKGRQVLAMHPEVVAEVTVANSDKVSGEILRTLPYLSPMVIYPEPPVFKSWTKLPGQTVSREYQHPDETSMRLLGFITFSHSPIRERDWADVRAARPGWLFAHPKRPMYEIFEECHYDSHDTQGVDFGVIAIFNVCDSFGRVIDKEINTLSIPFAREDTLSGTVDHLMERYNSDTRNPAPAKKWMRQVMSTIVGTLFYLCSTTLEAEPIPKREAMKVTPGARKPLSIYKVGWTMGSAITRYRHERSDKQLEQGGVEQEPQHRRGHFRHQWCGPKENRFCELIYISPYWTKVEQLGLVGVNTAHHVPRCGPPGSARESMRAVTGVNKALKEA